MVKLPGIGDEFAGYRIEALLGQGGMGIVYRAKHLGLDRSVALKLLPEGLTEDESFRARFERESRLAAGMEHPNIIPIYEAGEHEQLLYIVMRHVPGSDLKRLIEDEKRLQPDRAIALMAQAASALDAAHATDLLHRDVKPHNMLISPKTGWSAEHLYLTDFGLAKKTSSSAAITATGSFMGTVFYVAPEQIEGRKDMGPRVDVYSLGCVLFECLTGVVPFDGDSDVAVIGAHLNKPVPKMSERGLPPGLDHVMATAMAKDPTERYASCTDMIADARQVLAAAGWDVGTGASGEWGERPRADTLTAPAPAVDPQGDILGTVPTPKFRFQDTPAPPLRTQDAMGQNVPAKARKKRRWLIPLFTVLAVLLAATASYALLFRDDEGGDGEPRVFPARATSGMPERLPRRVGDFRFRGDKSEFIDVLTGFESLLGAAYQLSESQTFVNHYVAEYPTEEEAVADFEDQVAFLRGANFRVVERQPLENPAGAEVGEIVVLERTEPRTEEALAWTNGSLSVGVRGAPGQALEFFQASSY